MTQNLCTLSRLSLVFLICEPEIRRCMSKFNTLCKFSSGFTKNASHTSCRKHRVRKSCSQDTENKCKLLDPDGRCWKSQTETNLFPKIPLPSSKNAFETQFHKGNITKKICKQHGGNQTKASN